MKATVGHDKIRGGADLQCASPLVRFNHVIDPHFVAFSSSLYTTICNSKPNPNLNSNPDPNLDPNPNPNPNRDQWSLIRRQAVEIRKLSPFRSAPLRILSCAGNGAWDVSTQK